MKQHFFLILTLFFASFAHAQMQKQSDWQQQVSYHITAELDDAQHMLIGQWKLVYTNNAPESLKEIYIHLWPNAYRDLNTPFAKQQLQNGKTAFQYSSEEDKGYIDQLSFMVNGNSVTWQYYRKDMEVAILSLASPLESGQSITITTPFRLKIPKVFSRLGHEGQDYFMTQWYPKPAVFDVNGWNIMPYLDQGEFYSEFGDFDVEITLPANYVLAATGELRTESEKTFNDKRKDYPLKFDGDSVPPSSADNKTVRFTANQVHDFAWFASKKFNIKESSVDIGGKTVTTRVVAYDPKELHLGYISTALNYYSDNVGEYPYSHATVVHGELKAGGGMEYPMITLCDVMSEDVIIHEVGHNWFYGILANNEREYPWMDESINSFYDSRARAFNDQSTGATDFTSRVFNILVKDKVVWNEHQAFGGHSKDFTSINYGSSVYGIGARAFDHLHAYLGNEVFKTAMRAYYDEWKFKHPLPKDMQNSFEQSTGKDLSWFFEGLVNTNDALDYKLGKKKSDVVLTNRKSIAAPVPVVYSNEEGVVGTEWASAPKGESVILNRKLKAGEYATIDPDGLTLDLFPDNDKTRFNYKLKAFTGPDKKGVKEIYAMPAVAWNIHDGGMVGGVLHNYSFSDKKFMYHIVPLYSFRNNTVNGIAKWNYINRGADLGARTTYSLELQKFSWSPLGFDEFNYFKLNPEVEFTFAPKSLRSPVSQSLTLGYDRIGFTPNFDLEEARQASFNPNYSTLDNWNFLSVAYERKNDSKMNGSRFWLELEYGNVSTRIINGMRDTLIQGTDTLISFPSTGEETDVSEHIKLSAIYETSIDIGIKDKALRIRTFASYFFDAPEFGYFLHNITYTGNTAMRNDYRFNELAMGRNTGEGMLRNQVMREGSNSRFVGILGQSDKLIANVIVSVPIPGKLPIIPYAEFMTFTDVQDAFWNDSQSSLIYTIGAELDLGIMSIYFNLAQSKDIGSAQENIGIDKFKERITFSLKLDNLSPPKLKRSINLF